MKLPFLFSLLRHYITISRSPSPQACFEKKHKKRSQPKKLALKTISDEKKYSECAEKGSVSEKSKAESDLLALAGFKKEEKERRKGVRISLCIHFCLLVVFSFFYSFSNSQACSGRFVNPITDICWKCIFPITIAGVPVARGEDTATPRNPICTCNRPPYVGIPISFWEPVRLVDVTRTPYCMINLGGIRMGPSTSIRGHGTVGHASKGHMQQSFYQVHWYVYPLIHWLELLLDFACLEKTQFDVAYLTELDPLWNDDETSFIINPEAALFGNPIAQAACAADCAAASLGFSYDALFWCGGCQGSLYPFTGTVSAHSGGVQASLLLTQRFMAKLHREGLLWGYSGLQGLCGKYPMPIIRKSQYKTQMTYPIPATHDGCHPLGRSDLLWSAGRNYPYKGEDFGYLIWRKRLCCVL